MDFLPFLHPPLRIFPLLNMLDYRPLSLRERVRVRGFVLEIKESRQDKTKSPILFLNHFPGFHLERPSP